MAPKTKGKKVQPGVVGKPTPYYITAKDVMELLGVKDSKAGQIVKALRDELVEKDMLPPFSPVGKVPRQYFYKRFMIEP